MKIEFVPVLISVSSEEIIKNSWLSSLSHLSISVFKKMNFHIILQETLWEKCIDIHKNNCYLYYLPAT